MKYVPLSLVEEILRSVCWRLGYTGQESVDQHLARELAQRCTCDAIGTGPCPVHRLDMDMQTLRLVAAAVKELEAGAATEGPIEGEHKRELQEALRLLREVLDGMAEGT